VNPPAQSKLQKLLVAIGLVKHKPRNFQRYLDGAGGDAAKAMSDLAADFDRELRDALDERESENAKLRQKNRQLTNALEEAEGAKPQEGAVVLTGEAAVAYAALQKRGALADVVKRLEAADTEAQELAGLRRERSVRDVAELAGYKPKVLAMLLAANPALVLEVTEKDGAKVATVKDGEKAVPLADYAASNWSDMLPALTTTPVAAAPKPAAPAIGQGAGAGGIAPSANPAMDFLNKINERATAPNPLNPAR
jgi:hypothetical protein